MKRIIFIVLTTILPHALASGLAADAHKPYIAVCEEDQATLRRFSNGRWVGETLPATGRYELEKIAVHPSPPDAAPLSAGHFTACTNALITNLSAHIQFVEHCYAVKETGRQGERSERREMCSEYYYDGELVSVECRMLNFQPNGTFQSRRWLTNNEQGSQDSVLQASGRCRVTKR